MLKRRRRNHKISTVVAKNGAQLAPTPGYLQIEGQEYLASCGKARSRRQQVRTDENFERVDGQVRYGRFELPPLETTRLIWVRSAKMTAIYNYRMFVG